jgi:hypothetical protein
MKALLYASVLGLFLGACGSGGQGGDESGGGGTSLSTGDGGAGGGSAGSGGSSAGAGGGTGGSTGRGGAGGSAGTGGRGGTGGAAGAGGSAGAGGTSGAGGTTMQPGCSTPDACPAPNGGVTIDCEKRFLYGVNYAWANFGSDFGGGNSGVAANRSARLSALQDMKANGVDVVRWWVFPNFQAGGVAFDGNGSPTGLAGTTATDIAAALDLAAQAGVHIQFTLFSFDNFKTANNTHNLAPIISDNTKRAALMANVVTAFANEVKKSANKLRANSWDIINEPEWAVSGSDGTDMAFTPQTTVTTVSYAVMKTFISDAATALHAASDRPVTVGNAAIKWAKAWAGIGDFYTFHMYDWVNMSFPYDRPLSQYGVTDKPVVLGEFPIQGLTGVPYATLVGKIFDLGYAGATAWSVTDTKFPWAPNKANVKAFADAKGCLTSY